MRQIVTYSLLFVAITACTPLPFHHPVPEKALSQATVFGFPQDIRFWADEAPEGMEHMVSERIKLYQQTHVDYYATHQRYPAINYLAISGGAYDGAFGAGLLSGWSDAGTRPEFMMITGVSTGALIAPFVFVGQKYDPLLRDFYTNTKSDNIFNASVWKVVDGITGGLALIDSSPLAEKIRTSVTPQMLEEIAEEHRKGRRLYVITTHIEAQRGMIWDIGAIAASNNPDALMLVHKIMLASASVPGLFEPVFIDVTVGNQHYSEIHADGGVTSQVFAYPLKLNRMVIDEFKQAGLKRRMYIIRNSKVTPEYKAMEPGLFSLSGRSLETLTKYQGLGDLYRLYIGTKRDDIDYNLATIPADFLETSNEIFDPIYMQKLFALGYAMGKRQDGWMKTPPGVDYLTPATGASKLGLR